MPDTRNSTVTYFESDVLFRLRTNGRRSLIVDFYQGADHLELIHRLTQLILGNPPKNLTNIISASLSLTLVFSIDVAVTKAWKNYFLKAKEDCKTVSIQYQKHQIPVCYDSKVAPDTDAVCKILQCNPSQLIEAHSSVEYRVDMLGFLPGFAYMSGLPQALQLPRKSKPTLSVVAGSVAIAEQYSAIYPLGSPAGWHVIGHSHFQCIDWKRSDFCRFKPLDTACFVPITFDEWLQQSQAIKRGKS